MSAAKREPREFTLALPPRFSTAYRAGWERAREYGFGAHYGAKFAAVSPAAPRELVRP